MRTTLAAACHSTISSPEPPNYIEKPSVSIGRPSLAERSPDNSPAASAGTQQVGAPPRRQPRVSIPDVRSRDARRCSCTISASFWLTSSEFVNHNAQDKQRLLGAAQLEGSSPIVVASPAKQGIINRPSELRTGKNLGARSLCIMPQIWKIVVGESKWKSSICILVDWVETNASI